MESKSVLNFIQAKQNNSCKNSLSNNKDLREIKRPQTQLLTVNSDIMAQHDQITTKQSESAALSSDVWSKQKSLIERRKEIIQQRKNENSFKKRAVSQSQSSIFRQKKVKNKQRSFQYDLGNWQSKLEEILPEKEDIMSGALTEDETQKSVIFSQKNTHNPSQKRPFIENAIQNKIMQSNQDEEQAKHQVINDQDYGQTFDQKILEFESLKNYERKQRLKSAVINIKRTGQNQIVDQKLSPPHSQFELKRPLSTKKNAEILSGEQQITHIQTNKSANSFVKYFRKKNPYQIAGDPGEVIDSSVNSSIQNAFADKPLQVLSDCISGESKRVKTQLESQCKNRTTAEQYNQFGAIVNQYMIDMLKSENFSNVKQFQRQLTCTRRELTVLNDAQYRDMRVKYVPPTIEELIRMQKGNFQGPRTVFEQRIDRMRIMSELEGEDMDECNLIQFQKQIEVARHNKLLKQIGAGQNKSETTQIYRQHSVFPQAAFDQLDGFKQFLTSGYQEMIKREERNVSDALFLDADHRTQKDIQLLIRKYLQQYCEEFKSFNDERFYSSLQYGCGAVTNFAKNSVIPADPLVMRIVYRGSPKDANDRLKSLKLNAVLDPNQSIYNDVCGHDSEENCNQDCVNDLIVFEIKRKLFEELKMGEKKHEEYEMSIFLSAVEFIQKLTNQQINELAKYAKVRKYNKNAIIFQECDFPLQSFFIVKKGGVSLKKSVIVEQNNFIPIECENAEYERRVQSRLVSHCLGKVKLNEQFGLLESLTNQKSSQMACQFGSANEDGTELVWFTKIEVVNCFKSDQITDLLEQLQTKPSLVQGVAEQELVLRSMVTDKLNKLSMPRNEIFPKYFEIPTRILKLVKQNKSRANNSKFDVLQLNPTHKPSHVRYFSAQNRKPAIFNVSEKLARQDFSAKQSFVADQKLSVADRAINFLFDQRQWNGTN